MSTITFAPRLVHFAHALRIAGLPLGLEQTECFARSMQWINVLSKIEVYYAARATLVTRAEDLALFDRTFERFFGAHELDPFSVQKTPIAPRHDPREFHRTALASFVAEKARDSDPEIEITDRSETASEAEILQKKDFSRLSSAEQAALQQAMRSIHWRVTERRTRRRVRARRGEQLDLRRTLHQASRSSGKVLSLPRKSRKIKQRPLVLIADISGSMEIYARLLLQFFHGLNQHQPHAETFVFGTRLTRITSQLRLRNVDRALEEVSAQVVDFAGGTRIGDCLATFNRTWGRRVLRRGAVVLIVSDGCERGDPQVLRREMRRLHGRSHRLIWLNPRLGGPSYRPLVSGMAAALEHVDDFLPIHNLQSLRALAQHLSRLPAQRTGRPPVESLAGEIS